MKEKIMEEIRGYCDDNEIRVVDFLDNALLEAKSPPQTPDPKVVIKTVYREKVSKNQKTTKKESTDQSEMLFCEDFPVIFSEDNGMALDYTKIAYNHALSIVPVRGWSPIIIAGWMLTRAIYYLALTIRGKDTDIHINIDEQV